MKINSVAMLCPLLQPVSLYSLPNAPSLVDLDWEETNTQTGKTSVFQFICPVFRLDFVTQICQIFIQDLFVLSDREGAGSSRTPF